MRSQRCHKEAKGRESESCEGKQTRGKLLWIFRYLASLPAGGATSCDKSHCQSSHLIVFLFLSYILSSFPVTAKPLLLLPVDLVLSQTTRGQFSLRAEASRRRNVFLCVCWRRRKRLLGLWKTPKKYVFQPSDAADVVMLKARKLHWQPDFFSFFLTDPKTVWESESEFVASPPSHQSESLRLKTRCSKTEDTKNRISFRNDPFFYGCPHLKS